ARRHCRAHGAVRLAAAAAGVRPDTGGSRLKAAMRVAFYAPLKPPDHPVPSGDRRMAQLFLDAWRHAGHEPFLASRLPNYDGAGDPLRQARLVRIARRSASRMLRQWQPQPETAPGLWFSY